MTEQILLVLNDVVAQLTLDTLGKKYGDVIVASCDKRYPLDMRLNERTFKSLTSDPKIKLIVLNFDCLNKIVPATNQLLVLDDILINLHLMVRRRELTHDAALTILSSAVTSFFNQYSKLDRASNFTFTYKNWEEYKGKGNEPSLINLLGVPLEIK